MKSFVIISILIGVLLTLSFYTKPTAEQHQQHIYMTLQAQFDHQQAILQRQLVTGRQWTTQLALFLVKMLAHEERLQFFVQAKLLKASYQDYLFFSTITLKTDTPILVSFGLCGQIFVNHHWYYKPGKIGLLKFLSRLTPFARVILIILLVMSITTWYLFIVKTLSLMLLQGRASYLVKQIWHSASLDEILTQLKPCNHPVSHLAWQAIQTSQHYQSQYKTHSTILCSHSELITRAMRQALTKDKTQLESGLTWLAMVASTAPFIGLLGTVVGIYSALITMSNQNNVTITIVAAPVGEALLMTAFGLAVAIPATLGYNFLLRWQRHFLLKLEGFAHELHTYLNTGAKYPHV